MFSFFGDAPPKSLIGGQGERGWLSAGDSRATAQTAQPAGIFAFIFVPRQKCALRLGCWITASWACPLSSRFRKGVFSGAIRSGIRNMMESSRDVGYHSLVPDISPHKRGSRFIFAILLAIPVIMWAVPIALSWYGWSPKDILFAIVPLVLILALVGSIGAARIGCPACGRSVFLRGPLVRVPSPARKCSKCGRDLTTA
jgi:hypothetical protein